LTKFVRSKNHRTHLSQGIDDRFFRKINKNLPSASGPLCAATFDLFCINNDTETIKECSITCSVASTNYQLSLEFVVILINNKAEGKSE